MAPHQKPSVSTGLRDGTGDRRVRDAERHVPDHRDGRALHDRHVGDERRPGELHTTATSATCVVASSLSVGASTNQTSYTRRQTVSKVPLQVLGRHTAPRSSARIR